MNKGSLKKCIGKPEEVNAEVDMSVLRDLGVKELDEDFEEPCTLGYNRLYCLRVPQKIGRHKWLTLLKLRKGNKAEEEVLKYMRDQCNFLKKEIGFLLPKKVYNCPSKKHIFVIFRDSAITLAQLLEDKRTVRYKLLGK
jgi:hypothetical protein